MNRRTATGREQRGRQATIGIQADHRHPPRRETRQSGQDEHLHGDPRNSRKVSDRVSVTPSRGCFGYFSGVVGTRADDAKSSIESRVWGRFGEFLGVLKGRFRKPVLYPTELRALRVPEYPLQGGGVNWEVSQHHVAWLEMCLAAVLRLWVALLTVVFEITQMTRS